MKTASQRNDFMMVSHEQIPARSQHRTAEPGTSPVKLLILQNFWDPLQRLFRGAGGAALAPWPRGWSRHPSVALD